MQQFIKQKKWREKNMNNLIRASKKIFSQRPSTGIIKQT